MPTPLDPESFLKDADAAARFVAEYWRRVSSLPVLSRAAPGQVRAAMPTDPPEHPEPDALGGLLADMERFIVPGLTHWQHPSFFAYFPANTSGPSVVGEMLSAGLGVQGMLWQTSPACTEVETHVLDWLAGLVGLPPAFTTAAGGGGVIHSTASEAALVALAAARDRVRRTRKRAGIERDHCTIYASSQAHSSIVKAAMIAGLADGPDDRAHVRLIATDREHRMDPAALARALDEDLAAGRRPILVVATLGTTGSTAFDPLPAIARVLRERGLDDPAAPVWLHADAAHAGSAMICPESRGLQEGVERCDSYCFNPHKWLLTGFDCDCFFTRHPRALTDALSITPDYLRNEASDAGGVIDYRDWQIPLGRRFRSLKLWLVLRAFGVSGLRAYIREHVRLAAWFEAQVRGDGRFEIAAPRTLNLVCFRLRAGDTPTRELMHTLNRSGAMYLTHTTLPEHEKPGAPSRFVLRLAVGGSATSEADVRSAWEAIRSAAG